MPLTPNTTILDGKYTIIRQLGKGAFAYVWLAEDHAVGQQVAIKELRHSELSRDEFVELSRRFQREARIGRALRHPNLVEVYTVEQWDNDLLLVMEYVEGETLQERLDRGGPLPLEAALDVAMQLCDALDVVHAHPLGIVHRDIKSSNVLVSERGQAKLSPKLSDFGVAQLAGETGRTFGSGRHHPGTPLYMAPEQASGFDYLAPAADVYALGLIVGEMLVGRPVKPRLLRGDTWGEVLSEEPSWLVESLEKSTAEEWRARYRKAGELKAALQAGSRAEAEARERARRETEEQVRQEKLASLYDAAQAALKAKRWEEAIQRCDDIAAIDASYQYVAQLRAQAWAGLRAQQQAEEARKRKLAELARLYEAAQMALKAQDWRMALKHCEEMERLEPGYRDMAQIKAQAQAKLREQREAEEWEHREREREVRKPEKPQPPLRRMPLSTWAFVIVLVVGLAAIGAWALDALRVKPTPVVVEKVVTVTPKPAAATVKPTTNTSVPLTTTPVAPEGVVFVPAGEFIMGSPDGEGYDDERPQHTVYLDAYYMDEYEVTNEQFSQFVDATGYTTDAETEGWGWAATGDTWGEVEGAEWRHPQGPDGSIEGKMDHPVVQVSWNDADAYCQWVGKRLPTEAEWEKAARGTDGREYPWGNSVADGSKLNYDLNVGDTTEVGAYPDGASPYGAMDMAGNVWEWVVDWYDANYYGTSPESNPQGPDSGEYRVLRGGSWDLSRLRARCANRDWSIPDDWNLIVGFRCCAVATSSL